MSRRPSLAGPIALIAIVAGFAFVTPTPRPAPSHPAISAAAGQPSSGGTGTLETASGTDGATARTGTPVPPATLHNRPSAALERVDASQRPRVDSDATARAQTAPRASGKAQTAHVATAGHAITGTATWYCSPTSACTAGYPMSCRCAAAGAPLRAAIGPGWRGRYVTVATRSASIRVRLVDVCVCDRVVDLFAAAFSALAPLSAGAIHVEVSW